MYLHKQTPVGASQIRPAHTPTHQREHSSTSTAFTGYAPIQLFFRPHSFSLVRVHRFPRVPALPERGRDGMSARDGQQATMDICTQPLLMHAVYLSVRGGYA